MITVTITGLPPSDNNAYRTAGRRRVLTKKGDGWKKLVDALVRAELGGGGRAAFSNRLYTVVMSFYMPLYARTTGRLHRWDHSSHQKLTLDAIANAIGSDDAACLQLLLLKFNADEKRTVLQVMPHRSADIDVAELLAHIAPEEDT